MEGWCKKDGVGIKVKQYSLPKLHSNPESVQGTFSEEPGIALAGALPFLVELLNVLCSVRVVHTFSKSSRTGKRCQFAARRVLAFPGSISVFCNSRGRRIQILPVAFPLNIPDKMQEHVYPSDMSLDS